MTTTHPPLLGIDHGLKRIGIAISDRLWWTARPVMILKRTTNADDFRRIAALIDQHQVAALIVGIPEDDEAPVAFTHADKVRSWVTKLNTAIALPVVFWVEHMSSVDALDLARAHHRPTRDPIDDLAATVILQSYLDALRDGLASPPPSIIDES